MTETMHRLLAEMAYSVAVHDDTRHIPGDWAEEFLAECANLGIETDADTLTDQS